MTLSPGRRKIVIAGVLLGLFLSALESTVVSTAMPTIVASLGGLSIFSWVFSGYLLSSTLTMPLWGRLSDLHGRRPLFLTGVFIFMAGSALCGLARSMHQLILFRFLQGMGAGAVMPLTFTIIGDIFTLEQRAKAQGLFSGVWGVASIIGPFLGGYLADHVSWRWVFYINVPFSLLAMFLIRRGLEESARPQVNGGALDVSGTLMFAGSVLSLLVGLSLISRRVELSILLFVLSAMLLFFYVRTENRAEHPILPLKLFRIRIFSAAQGGGFFSGMAMFGALSFIPLYMQSVLGSTATEAGRILLPFMLSWVAFSILGSRVLLRAGYRKLVIAGSVLLLAGFALMTALGSGRGSLALLSVSMILAGAGMGFSMAPFLIAVQNAVPRDLMGAATSATQFIRTVGGAVGVAVMGSTLGHFLKARSEALLASSSLEEQLMGKMLEHPDALIASGGAQAASSEFLTQVRMQMAAGLHRVFLAGLLFALFSLLACLAVPDGSAHSHARGLEDSPLPE